MIEIELKLLKSKGISEINMAKERRKKGDVSLIKLMQPLSS